MGKPAVQSVAAHLFRGVAKKRRHQSAVEWLQARQAPKPPEAPTQDAAGDVDVAELEAVLSSEG